MARRSSLAAAVSGTPRPGDFFPLTCDYRERVAAAGKFPGGFPQTRRPADDKETLTARLMDRPIRPLFPDGYRDEVQIQAFVMASDRQNDGDVLAMNGASTALGLSPLPFQGPVGSVRLGSIGGEFVAFPTHDALEESDLDLIISGNRDSILMIEGFAREMPEDRMLEAIRLRTTTSARYAPCRRSWPRRRSRSRSRTSLRPSGGVLDTVRTNYYDAFRAAKQTIGKLARADACQAVKEKALAETVPDPAVVRRPRRRLPRPGRSWKAASSAT